VKAAAPWVLASWRKFTNKQDRQRTSGVSVLFYGRWLYLLKDKVLADDHK
jgi:hypothetical protein